MTLSLSLSLPIALPTFPLPLSPSFRSAKRTTSPEVKHFLMKSSMSVQISLWIVHLVLYILVLQARTFDSVWRMSHINVNDLYYFRTFSFLPMTFIVPFVANECNKEKENGNESKQVMHSECQTMLALILTGHIIDNFLIVCAMVHNANSGSFQYNLF